MKGLKNKRWMPLVMGITILGITAFQIYWLQNTYEREKRTLEIRTNMLFRETVHRLQGSKLKLERPPQPPLGRRRGGSGELGWKESAGLSDRKIVRMLNVVRERVKDSMQQTRSAFYERPRDTLTKAPAGRRTDRIIQFLYDVDSLQDTLRVKEVYAAFSARMDQQNLDVPFTITRIEKENEEERIYNEVTIGFAHPITYRVELGNTFPFLIRRITAPVLLSLFIVSFTIFSFVLLYRNLLRQQRLGDIKNEFISNITHELKTPIATVSVAIEALRSFNASMDPRKTKEYLDISANELQRLSLLVDKVLKLSMFEKKEIELKYEILNLEELVREVTSSMRLQLEKHQAELQVTSEGDQTFEGDRLHIVSVLFNLLDNALKYCPVKPRIDIHLRGDGSRMHLTITDNGIGIPAEYKDKVFEKFFRVPTGNLHNAKGYGLGLSYVAHVVRKHQGNIRVDSLEGEGSRFTITLPKQKV